MGIRVLAAGATESTLRGTVGVFERESGETVQLSFGAVGLLRDQIQAGEAADLAIVTPAIIEQLEAKALVEVRTRVALGRLGGGIAVPAGATRPVVERPEDLRRALLDAQEIYYADPATATAGAHLLRVADRLEIGAAVRQKGRTAAGGRAAMQAMALSTAKAVGLAQISEILSVPEVTLVGPYPEDLQVLTTYSGVLLTGTRSPEAAQAFLRFLVGPLVQGRLQQAGFLPAL